MRPLSRITHPGRSYSWRRILLIGFVLFCLLSLPVISLGQSTTRMFHRLHIYHPNCPTNVTALLQDQRGFIWMGCRDGLYRFDGYEFLAFRNDPTNGKSLGNNNIQCLFEDKSGNIWIGAAGSLQLLDPKTLLFHQPDLKPEFLDKMKSCNVSQILEDKNGYIWIVTDQLGVLRYHPNSQETKAFQDFGEATAGSSKNQPYGMVEDHDRNLWLSAGYGIYRYLPAAQKFSQVPFEVSEVDSHGNSLNNKPLKFVATATGDLWTSTFDGGLYRLNTKTGDWSSFQHDPEDPESLSDNRILGIYQDSRKNLWVSTVKGGLNRYNAQRQKFMRYQNAPGEINSLSANHVYSVLEDRNGLIWVGTIKGVDILRPTNANFEFYQKELNAKSTLTDNRISALWKDKQGYLWIGTRTAGLNRYDFETGAYKAYQHRAEAPNSLGNNTVWCILEDKRGRLWVGTSEGILNLFDPATESFRRFKLPNIRRKTFTHEIRCISEDEHGILWLGTLGSGLYAFDPQKESFQMYRSEDSNDQSLPSNAIFTLQADQKGGLWVGTLSGGACYFDLEEHVFNRYPKDPGQNSGPNFKSKENIYALFIDRQQRVWIGTADARLGLYDPEKDAFKFFFEKNMDASYIVIGITDDAEGNLWLATDGGLLHFTPPHDPYAPESEGVIQRYTREDGLQDNDFFKTTAVHQTRTGHIYVGGHLGFNRFHPDSLASPIKAPKIVLTDFQVFNQSVGIASGRDSMGEEFYLEQHIEYLDKVVLTHRQRVFSVHFATTNFNESRQNRFAYRLIGFNPDWIDIRTQHSVTFTNLNAGKYTLEIKAADSDGDWSKNVRTLRLVVIPPWYQTRIAYLGFTLLISATVYSLFYFNLRRRLQQEEAKRAIEMTALRSRLYTNITHEFRTPLTVIMGMSEQLSEDAQQLPNPRKEKLSSGLTLIQRNGKNLLRLINQLLDLSKLDSGKLKLNMIQGDIVPYLQYLTESFFSMADDKGIRLTVYAEERSLLMDYDEEKIQQIVYNLLSNAIKFTPERGKVIFHILKARHANSEQLQMKVIDTGVGMTPEDLQHVFDRFYQADGSSTRKGEGTGIGLALTKELVELMKGEIQVESTPGKGSTFIIQLPISREYPLQQTPASRHIQAPPPLPVSDAIESSTVSTVPEEKSELPILLIIEDNVDVAMYIKSLLEKEYIIHTAENGQIGIDRAIDLVPDIIISDVMMPEKDGYEVCHTLKQDERTSHIPIILLTARAGQEDRIDGLHHGADAYLTKPFQKRELMIRLKKLVELRQQLQKRFSAKPITPRIASAQASDDKESQFLQKLRHSVLEQMDKPDFGVPQLAHSALMSHTQMYRKLKALTDQTPSQFIRSIRLQKGKELLLTTDMTISEIAYEVGFSDPNYFSRMFNKEFNVPPRDLRK